MTKDSDAYNIFLSYAHIDNQPDTDDVGEDRWVDHFQSRLLRQLRKRGQHDIGFWRDVAEIDGGHRFRPRIIEGLEQSDFFLPILSPTYVQRPWCEEELQRFAGRLTQEPELDDRIFPIYKRPLGERSIPELLREREGYRFYREDEVYDRVIEFFRGGEVKDNDAYADLLDKIADAICARIPAAAPHATVPNPEPGPDTTTIFVAQPADDMYAAYDKVVTELKSRGIRVVVNPDEDLTGDPDNAETAISEALDEAKLVVHLLGEQPGSRVGNARLVDMQLAQTYANSTARLIWAPTILFVDPTGPESTAHARTRDPLAVLREFGEFRDGDGVSGMPFEAFLRDLVRRCQDFQVATCPSPPMADGEGAQVYVVGARDDASLVHKVTGTLIDNHGLRAYPCGFGGSDDERRRLHADVMRDSDAVLYCWGKATDVWLLNNSRETRSSAELGRERPFLTKALFPGPPLTDYKRDFRCADLSLYLPAADEVTPDVFTELARVLR